MTPSSWVRKARCPSPVLDSSESEPRAPGFTLRPNQGAESYAQGPGEENLGYKPTGPSLPHTLPEHSESNIPGTFLGLGQTGTAGYPKNSVLGKTDLETQKLFTLCKTLGLTSFALRLLREYLVISLREKPPLPKLLGSVQPHTL